MEEFGAPFLGQAADRDEIAGVLGIPGKYPFTVLEIGRAIGGHPAGIPCGRLGTDLHPLRAGALSRGAVDSPGNCGGRAGTEADARQQAGSQKDRDPARTGMRDEVHGGKGTRVAGGRSGWASCRTRPSIMDHPQSRGEVTRPAANLRQSMPRGPFGKRSLPWRMVGTRFRRVRENELRMKEPERPDIRHPFSRTVRKTVPALANGSLLCHALPQLGDRAGDPVAVDLDRLAVGGEFSEAAGNLRGHF